MKRAPNDHFRSPHPLGLISSTDGTHIFKDGKHHYKFNIPVGPGKKKDVDKEKKKEEKTALKKEAKERKKERKKTTSEIKEKETEEKSSDSEKIDTLLNGISHSPSRKPPIAVIPLYDSLLRLEKQGSYIRIVLSRTDGKPLVIQKQERIGLFLEQKHDLDSLLSVPPSAYRTKRYVYSHSSYRKNSLRSQVYVFVLLKVEKTS